MISVDTMFFTLLDILPLWGVREPFSALSHLLGVLISLVALRALVRAARQHGLQRRALRSLVVYGVSMLLVFTASTLFHLFEGPPERLELLRKLDHAAIFVIIAGTSTAVYGTLQERWSRRLVVVTWTMALGALVVKLLVWPMASLDSTLVYLSVGCIPAAGAFEFARIAGWKRLKHLVAALVVLFVGAVVFVTGRPVVWPGVVEGHEVFHVLVLLGMGLLYRFIHRCCIRCPKRAAMQDLPSQTLNLSLHTAPCPEPSRQVTG